MIVFVHGVPETAAIWDKARSLVDRPSVALSMPGFGTARPEGFGATKDDYVDWLVGELDDIAEPVDLVGHDWGAGLTYRVATAHGDSIRSWVADVGNILHPDYQWHAFATTWQTPGEGEAAIESAAAQPSDERAAGYEMLGVPSEDAVEMADAFDLTMGRCILDLYRSATPNPHAQWGPWSPTRAPGMVIHPTQDPFSDEILAGEVAQQLAARFETIEGAGHFWPYQAPEKVVPVLETFWSTLA